MTPRDSGAALAAALSTLMTGSAWADGGFVSDRLRYASAAQEPDVKTSADGWTDVRPASPVLDDFGNVIPENEIRGEMGYRYRRTGPSSPGSASAMPSSAGSSPSILPPELA